MCFGNYAMMQSIYMIISYFTLFSILTTTAKGDVALWRNVATAANRRLMSVIIRVQMEVY